MVELLDVLVVLRVEADDVEVVPWVEEEEDEGA